VHLAVAGADLLSLHYYAFEVTELGPSKVDRQKPDRWGLTRYGRL